MFDPVPDTPGGKPAMPRSTQIEIGVPAGYPELVAELKTRIRSAQVRAAFAVNRELKGT